MWVSIVFEDSDVPDGTFNCLLLYIRSVALWYQSSWLSSAGEESGADGNLHMDKILHTPSLWELWKQWSVIWQWIPESPLSCGMGLWWDQHYWITQLLLQLFFIQRDWDCLAALCSRAPLHSWISVPTELLLLSCLPVICHCKAQLSISVPGQYPILQARCSQKEGKTLWLSYGIISN